LNLSNPISAILLIAKPFSIPVKIRRYLVVVVMYKLISTRVGRFAMFFRIATFSFLGILVGCGGSSSSDPAIDVTDVDVTDSSITPVIDLTGTFKFFGYVDFTDDTVDDRINYEANYLELTEAQDASIFVNSVPPAVDSCKLNITATISTDVGVIGFPDAQFNFVSAGENFTLTSEAGTYATVNYTDSRFEIAPYPVPANLVLDIPGDVFPTFSDVTIPEVVRVTNFNPGRNDVLRAETTVTWDPTGVSGNTVYLSVFDIFASDKVVHLYCRMADDGEFNLPANVQTVLNSSLGAGAELEGAKQDLRSMTTIVQGDTLLVVSKILDTL
jgi:hypothetical protein